MEDRLKNKLGFWTFFIIVITLLVGGYFLTDYLINNDFTKDKEEKPKEVISYKIDEDKEYIYYKNEEVISEEAEIYYKDVVINIKNQDNLTESLETENQIYKSNIKYLSDQDLLSEELIHYNYDNLYALTFREYKVYEYDNYVSLVLIDYNYSCFDEKTFIGTKSYIFDISNGSLLQNEDILKKYNVTIDSVKENIRTLLQGKQSVVEEVELIKIEETINNLNYSLYIDEYGKLFISFLVKTTQVDYNEIMEV